MGLKPRLRAERLPEKLKRLREGLGLSQNEILIQLGFADRFDRSTISHYETGEREPSLPILLRYAQLANIYVDVLIDDKSDLPDKIPCKIKSEGQKLS
jgi:transcriptional regulator with XRE-family HTH domain